ncbi:hypothetical protein JCGZ_13210 [Jatropha curcas]|uniref:TFIIS central domain-containing protein n=1 Tax=Jatropha curcas TaxID=180498 RepID=A0A067KJ58_JATCU|nr:uncharacterized protein LOC105639453 [Jatropha curcas]KDP32285.1 hypothetical protein JCGZ_13210 [Jatropha curcas]
MSNKLMSQQMSMPNMQMGMMGPGSTCALSQQISVPNSQAQSLSSMPNSPNLQKLSVSNMQMGQMNPQAYNLMPEQVSLPSKQLGDTVAMLNNAGSYHSSMLHKRKAPVESTSNNPALPKLSMPNKRVAQAEHRPWLQQISTPNKLQSISNTSGLQRSQAPSKKLASGKAGLLQSSVQKNKSGQPSPKVQNEPTESVRSKLKESLAAALALVSQQQDRPSNDGKNSQSETASTAGSVEKNPQSPGYAPGTLNFVNRVSKEPEGSMPTGENSLAQQCNDGQSILQGISSNSPGDSAQTPKYDGQDYQPTINFHDEDASYSDSFFVKDELLQGNGLSWVLEADMKVEEKKDIETSMKQSELENVSMENGGQVVLSPQILASQIEAELYKLFGGVNKKYKEKGRSLLFNLKDRNNPELRERVTSGEISPERLCSMTAEELASKELSQWRIAKAEELAQMVVLPDSGVDMRRLVKKTHKGEFVVEVETQEQDSLSAEVTVGATLTQTQRKPKEKGASSPTKPDEMKDKGKDAASEKSRLEDQSVLMINSNEGTDLMQGLMVDDELKDAEFLPPIVSLDEFLESLNSEPPFENLPADTEKATPISDKDDSQIGAESESPDSTQKDSDDTTSSKADAMDVRNEKSDADKESDVTDVTDAHSDADKKSTKNNVKSEAALPVGIPKGEEVWEGLIQLNMSTVASVIGIFKSGEKASAKDWPGCIEIKGRVRLDAFEKFLQELPMSRSRAVMAVHFACKEGSTGSERASLSEVADSYIADQRVGFAEPVRGMELYFCPPHFKTNEMLGRVLPMDKIDAINAIDNGLVGVIVWRKPQITSTMSHPRHNSKKHHFTSRTRQQDKNVNHNVDVSVTAKDLLAHVGPTPFTKPQLDNGDDDDVPPGFGPPVARDEDDLPEFNFSTPFNSRTQTQSRPVDQMRQLVQRYGQAASNANWQDNNRDVRVSMQPWNDDDDDDMPEWRPEDNNKPQLLSQPVHQQNVHQQPILVQQTPAMPLHPQMNIIHTSQNVAWMGPSRGPYGPSPHPAYQYNYRAPGLEAAHQGIAWRRDAPSSRGF